MIKRFGVAVSLLSLVGCAAADESSEPEGELGVSEAGIVRADSEGGRDSAVAVIGRTIFGGNRYCSGVLVAPRVVITAAHCLSDIVDRTIVYWGADVMADKAEFDAEDDPSKPWTVAESWEQHPDYVPDLHYPDLAVVYLPRSLPFAPAELGRFRLRDRDIGTEMKVVGWGASRALTPDISVVEGMGIQRRAKIPFLGSPTEADFVPEDPNNGLFVPRIREHLAKFDGTAPESNTCAGDSGAPIFAKRHNRSYVVAINFFTGLSCEGYSMATRVEPFLDYFDAAIERGGELPVKPTLSCVDEAADGTLTAFFGYDNQNAVTMNIPYGRDNRLSEDEAGVRPTRFLPGEHDFSFYVEFERRERLRYELRSPDAPGWHGSKVTVSSRSERCEPTAPDVSCARLCQNFDGCGFPFTDCMTDCTSSIPLFEQELPQCLAPWSAFNRCLAALPTEELCNYAGPPACEQELADYEACFSL
jgi:hypothetical protein